MKNPPPDHRNRTPSGRDLLKALGLFAAMRVIWEALKWLLT